MREELSNILADLGADYADIRFEENQKTVTGYEEVESHKIISCAALLEAGS